MSAPYGNYHPGRSVVVNFDPTEHSGEIYRKAGEHTGCNVYITDEAFDINGNAVPSLKGCHITRTDGGYDYSEFWACVRELTNPL